MHRAARLGLTTALCATAMGCPSVTVAWVPSWTQYNQTSSPQVSRFGMEDGIVVRRKDGGFTMLCSEMYDSPYAVAMQLGIYGSKDGLAWERKRTLRRSSANDNGTDIHAAHWGPLLNYNPKNETWQMSYVGYRAAKPNATGFLSNYDGTIFSRFATEPGDAGLDGDFGESSSGNVPAYKYDQIMLAPDDFNILGPWPHPCQGLQGTDSFSPYQLPAGGWAALVGTSHQEQPNPWPGSRWRVSVATAPELSGPWTRYNPANRSDPANAPCSDIAQGIENPIVARRPDDPKAFHAVYDGGANPGFGYACSEDGLAWAPGVGVPFPEAANVRTPFGLVPMTTAEVKAREKDILSYGVLNQTQIYAPDTQLQWLFLTGHNKNESWEHFQTAIVQLAW